LTFAIKVYHNRTDKNHDDKEVEGEEKEEGKIIIRKMTR
jgi:hypothetical protein